MKIRRIVATDVVDDFVIRCEMQDGEIFDYDMSFVHKKTEPLFVALLSY